MILVNTYNEPTPINGLTDAKNIDGFLYYDLQRRDYFASPISAVVELQSSALTLAINNNFLHLPVDWYTIVCDKMSGVIDTIQIHELTNTNFKLFAVGPIHHTVTELGYRVANFEQCKTFFYPMFTKQQMLCVAATPTKWILITPSDTYQKYVKHISPAELLM